MDIGIAFDWFTQDSINAALETTQWEQREYWLRLALLWGAAAREHRKNAASTPSATQQTSAVDRPRYARLRWRRSPSVGSEYVHITELVNAGQTSAYRRHAAKLALRSCIA